MAQLVWPRIRLFHLFYATAVLGAAIALMGAFWGISWASVVIAFWMITAIAPPMKFDLTWSEVICFIFFAMILVGMFLPPVPGSGGPASIRTQNANRMRQIALAILNYESANGHFPPAYVADEQGKPMYSWRVLILPYLDESDVFKKFNRDEPWDGPNNRQLIDALSVNSPLFQDESQRLSGKTNYKLIVGPETAFVDDQTVGFNAILAGAANTVLLVEDTANPVCWMEPSDVTIDQAIDIFDREENANTMLHEKETKFSKTIFNYSAIALMDGSTRFVGPLETPSEMREFFTIATPPKSDLDDLDFQIGTIRQTKAEGYLLVAINFFLAVLPRFWGRQSKVKT